MSEKVFPNDFLSEAVNKVFAEFIGRELVADGHSYFLCEKVGAGGQGFVFSAKRDKETEADYVVKLLFQQNETDLDRGLRELRIGELDHPHLAKAIGVGADKAGTVGVIFERVRGKSLKEWIDGEPIPLPTVIRWGIELSEALAFLHERGFVHRDVKPSNILIAEKEQSVKLADFGLCFDLNGDGPLTTTGVPGTLDYMSPERRTGGVSPQSDIYSLGMVLHEAATGKRIRYSGEIDVPNRDLSTVIACCLEPNQKNRYASAVDLKADLESIAINKPPKIAQSLRNRKRRRFVLKTATTLLLIVLTGMGIWHGLTHRTTAQPPEKTGLSYEPAASPPFRLLKDEDYPKVMSDAEMMQKMMEIHLQFSHPVKEEVPKPDTEQKERERQKHVKERVVASLTAQTISANRFREDGSFGDYRQYEILEPGIKTGTPSIITDDGSKLVVKVPLNGMTYREHLWYTLGIRTTDKDRFILSDDSATLTFQHKDGLTDYLGVTFTKINEKHHQCAALVKEGFEKEILPKVVAALK